MAVTFKNILVPVDFSVNTEVAVKKSIEIRERTKSIIHLFHVCRLRRWRMKWIDNIAMRKGPSTMESYDSVVARLAEWASSLQEDHPDLSVVADTIEALDVEDAIIEKASRIFADIIIIGKKSHHSLLPFLGTVSPNRIAKRTGFPVLTITPGSLHSKIRSVVVPIGTFVPERKVELILALRKKFRISIHLVTVLASRHNTDDFSAHALLNTYRFLRDAAQCPLDHEVLHGDNLAKEAFRYAQKIKADIILIDPWLEGTLGHFPDKNICDELMPNSKLQVLAVQA